MSELRDREQAKHEKGRSLPPRATARAFDVPVIVDQESCIAGCRICIDSCPVDCLAVDPLTKRAYMAHDECWYCLACELDCPRDAITVKIPFLLR